MAGSSDPLLVSHRLDEHQRRLDSHSQQLKDGTATVNRMETAVALMGRDLAEIRRIAEAESEDREERDKAWEARVSRLTAVMVGVGVTIVGGSIGMIFTFILTRAST